MDIKSMIVNVPVAKFGRIRCNDEELNGEVVESESYAYSI